VPYCGWLIQESSITVFKFCQWVTLFRSMYDDIDLSGGVFDFDDGGHLMSQQHESMYVDDDMYMDDMYSANSRGHLGLDESQNGIDDAANVAYYERISFSDLFDQCVIPTLSQAFFSLTPVVGLCLICRITIICCHIGLYMMYSIAVCSLLASFVLALIVWLIGFITGSIACSTKHQYLSCKLRERFCTDWGEIWHGRVDLWIDVLKRLRSYGGVNLQRWFFPNVQRSLMGIPCIGPPNVFEVQESARGPLSRCQVWLGSDFTHHRGSQKCWDFSVCLFLCLYVHHAFEWQSLRARFHHETIGV